MSDVSMAAPGRALPLLSQYDYTTGGCAVFARAAAGILRSEPALLFALEPKQFEEHDHPTDLPLCLHAFVIDGEGMAIDAEGRRPIRELAYSFGVREGWDFKVVRGVPGLDAEFPGKRPEAVAAAAALIREHGWAGGVPAADDSLTVEWQEVLRQRDARSGRRRPPTAEEARLYNLLPGYDMASLEGFERLEVRPHAEHGFVVVAVPQDPDGREWLVTAAGDEETAEDVACELEDETGVEAILKGGAHAP